MHSTIFRAAKLMRNCTKYAFVKNFGALCWNIQFPNCHAGIEWRNCSTRLGKVFFWDFAVPQWLTTGAAYMTHVIKLTFIYSLDTLWYSVRNLGVTCVFILSISMGLRTCILVWHRSIWGRLPFLAPQQSAGNWKRDLSFERPMPYPLHQWKYLFLSCLFFGHECATHQLLL